MSGTKHPIDRKWQEKTRLQEYVYKDGKRIRWESRPIAQTRKRQQFNRFMIRYLSRGSLVQLKKNPLLAIAIIRFFLWEDKARSQIIYG